MLKPVWPSPSDIKGNNVTSVTVGANGVISILYTGLSVSTCNTAAGTVTLTPASAGTGGVVSLGSGAECRHRTAAACLPAICVRNITTVRRIAKETGRNRAPFSFWAIPVRSGADSRLTAASNCHSCVG